MQHHKFWTALIIAISMMVIGCSEDNPMTPTPSGSASIRVIHASYDAPAVDIQVDGTVAISSLAYPTASGYAEVTEGMRNIMVTPAGATTPTVINADLNLEAEKSYTVYAVDALASIGALVSEDNRTPNSTKAKVRLVHTAPDAPAVDIKLNSGSGPAVFSNLAFKEFSDYAEVDGGSYTFVVTPAGATAEVVIFDPITVQNGMVYTVVAHGTLDAGDAYPFSVRVFIDNDTGNAFADLTTNARANVLVVHASPNAPGVDLLVDDTVVNSAALTYPNNTGYLEVNPGTRNFKVNASGTTTTVIDANVIVAADKYYSVFAIDFLDDITALVLEDDLTAPAAGKAHARFVHLSPDAPAVDVTLSDGTVLFGNYMFQDASDFTPLDAGTYDLQVRLAGSTTVVLDLPGINLADGEIYTVFAKGSVNGTAEQALGAELIQKSN